MLGLVFGVQVIQAAVEFVEAMRGRQVLVAITEVVLAELACHVALSLEQVGDRHVFLEQASGARPGTGGFANFRSIAR